MAYRIVEKIYGTLTTFEFWDDAISMSDPIAINPYNTMFVDQYDRPQPQFHFKTFETGANIFKKQEITLGDLIIEDESGTQYTPASIDEVWSRLEEINFFTWSGGGGSGGATAFTDLTDTFLYPGRALQALRVNASETGLETVYLYNKRYFTDLDDVAQAPLTGNDVFKRPQVQIIGGVPKLVLTDDNPNTPQAPNQIIVSDIQKTGDNEITLFANGLWIISGVQYTNAFDITRNVMYAESGKRRLDAGYLDENNNFLIATGTEVDLNQTAVLPSIPANTLLATIIDVTDNAVISGPLPNGEPWITKESMMRLSSYQTGEVELQWTNKTRIDIWAPCTLIGFSNNSGAPGYDLNYDGQMFYLQNSGSDEVLIQHQGEGGIPFWFPDNQDHLLPIDRTVWQFKFNKVDNRMEFVGNLETNTGGVSPVFEYPFEWNTGDPLLFDIEDDSRIAMLVFIDGTPIFKTDGLWSQEGSEIIFDPSVEDLYLINQPSKIKILGNGPEYDPTPPPEGRTVDDTIDLTVI